MNTNNKQVCPICHGEEWVERQDDIGYEGHITMVRCPDPAGIHKLTEIDRLTRISGLLPEEMAVRFSNVAKVGATSQMLRETQDFVAHPGGFLTLWGGYGNGKTLILQAAVNEFRERYGVIGTYVRLHDLLNHIRDGYAPNAREDARTRYERLKQLPVLAIDEFDAARMTDFAVEFRTAFLDDRYRLAIARRAHTLFAMNTNPRQLPGDIYDRLRDGRFVISHNTDRSMRQVLAYESSRRI